MNITLFGLSMLGTFAARNLMGTVVSRSSPSAIRKMSGTVQRMSVQEFDRILHNPERWKHQILDVREKHELGEAAIPGSDVIHLPLSEANGWSQDVLMGKLLDPEKPTLCLCHHGMRSMQVASFLGIYHFSYVS
jgi:rhodanese-related sulfurtransferase